MSRKQRRKSAKGGGSTIQLPDEIVRQLHDATRLHQSGQRQAAMAAYQSILDEHPNQPHALHLLGSLVGAGGDRQKALELIDASIKANGRIPEAHNNRGITLEGLGRVDEALAAFELACKIRSGFGAALQHAARLQLQQGRVDDAMKSVTAALKTNPDSGELHNLHAMILTRDGRTGDALTAIRRAIELQPDNRAHRHQQAAILGRIIPRWHFSMLNDEPRNVAYRKAIENVVGPDSTVLEIGTGSGLLSMMAARAGAASITTCEMVPEIAAMARRIIDRNGYADRIDVVDRKSTAIKVGNELPKRANVLISEILSDDFLGEGVLPSLDHARRELLEPDAKMVPYAGSLMAAVIQSRDLERWAGVESVEGFDLTQFNEFAPFQMTVPQQTVDLDLLSDAFELFHFDFREPQRSRDRTEVTATITAPGTCLGLIQWIRVYLDEETTYENPPRPDLALHPVPDQDVSHWANVFFRFDQPTDVAAGDEIRMAVARTARGIVVDRL